MSKEVSNTLLQFPIQIRARRAPVKPDEVQPEETNTLKLLPPPLMPHKVSDSPIPPLVDTLSTTVEPVASEDSVNQPAQNSNLLDGSIQGLDLFALSDLSITPVGERSNVENDDPFGSLSLTVQGRVIPCIPCENKSPTGQPPN